MNEQSGESEEEVMGDQQVNDQSNIHLMLRSTENKSAKCIFTQMDSWSHQRINSQMPQMTLTGTSH